MGKKSEKRPNFFELKFYSEKVNWAKKNSVRELVPSDKFDNF